MSDIREFEPLFNDWHVDEVLGRGSFGTVYKVHRDELGTRYYAAVKHFSIPASDEEVAALRNDGYNDKSISDYYDTLVKDITGEIRLMNRLKGHSNIVSIEDSAVIPKKSGTGYDVFIRMELLTSVTKNLARRDMTRAEVIKLGMDICSALEKCEAEEIIHRDIKPDNIFVNSVGEYKLGDFGVSRQLERTTAFMSKKGTYNYMAPEVYKGEVYGTSCDIYSLGLVMYRLLNRNRMPFMPLPPSPVYPSDSEKALFRRIKGETLPAPADADPALASIIIKACSVSVRNRYHSATEMKEDLSRVLNGETPKAVYEARAQAIRQEADRRSPAQRTGGYRAPSQQGTGYRAPSQQGAGYRAPTQQAAGYRAPTQQGAGYRAPSQQGTGYRAPTQQGTGYRAPTQQAAGYRLPAPNGYAVPTKKKKSKLILVILLALALIGAVVGLILILPNSCNKKSKDKKDRYDRSAWSTTVDGLMASAMGKSGAGDIIDYFHPGYIDYMAYMRGTTRDVMSDEYKQAASEVNITSYEITGNEDYTVSDDEASYLSRNCGIEEVQAAKRVYLDFTAQPDGDSVRNGKATLLLLKVEGKWYLFTYNGDYTD